MYSNTYISHVVYGMFEIINQFAVITAGNSKGIIFFNAVITKYLNIFIRFRYNSRNCLERMNSNV